jgi:hypothetical protein
LATSGARFAERSNRRHTASCLANVSPSRDERAIGIRLAGNALSGRAVAASRIWSPAAISVAPRTHALTPVICNPIAVVVVHRSAPSRCAGPIEPLQAPKKLDELFWPARHCWLPARQRPTPS